MCLNTSLLSLFSHLPRHCLQSTGYLLTEDMWHVAANAITHAFDVTLHCLRQLMTLFHEDSDNFYGDIGHVKVAVRKDCSGIECERLRQLAQQVRAALLPLSLEWERISVWTLSGLQSCTHTNV